VSAGVVGEVRDGGVDRVVMLRVGDVVPSRFQPRQVFDEVKLRELADSIRSIGVMQPVIVRRHGGTEGSGKGGEHTALESGATKSGKGGENTALESGATKSDATKSGATRSEYELVAGERRWRAAQLAGLERVPAIVRELDDESCAAWGLIENVQREDLDPMERAAACRVMMERFGVSASDLAGRLGLDRSTVLNLVRLTELEDEIQGMVRRGEVTMGHAKLLLGVPRENGARLALATLVSMEGWSVRKLESEVKKGSARVVSVAGRRGLGGNLTGGGKSAALLDLEKRLSEHFGTRVKIKTDRSGKRGRIDVAFYNLDHFEGLMQKLGFGLGG